MNKVSWGLSSIISILIMVLLFVPISLPVAAADDDLSASEGRFDLRNKVIAEEGPFELNGEWAFYWKELLTPADVAQNMSTRHFGTVPSLWNSYMLDGQPLPKYGYATYRLTVVIDEAETGNLYSLYMPSVATAYNLWVDGQLVASNGRVAETRSQMVPQNYPKVVTFTAERPEIEILVQVSNFHQQKAGLWQPITFGTEEQITALRERNILFQIFVVGSTVVIGFYHLVLFFYRPKDLSPLYLGIACFGVAFRTLLLKDTLLIYLLPQVSWEVHSTLEYLSALIAKMFQLPFFMPPSHIFISKSHLLK